MSQILVVEDEEHTRELVHLILEQVGYSVIAARDGRMALDLLRQARPALALLDINMPGMSGLDVLRTIRADTRLTFPVLMMTANGDAAMVRTALGAGASGYVLKPFTPTVLATRVAKTLAQAAAPAVRPPLATVPRR